MKCKYAFLKLIGSLLAVVLFAAPSLGAAQTTITKVLVVVGGVQYCDTAGGCANPIWNLGSGVALGAGQSLILTQTTVGGQNIPENFDTSDRANPNGPFCNAANPCAVQISIATAKNPSLTLVYDNSGNPPIPDPLNDSNSDPGGVDHNEAAVFQGAGATSEFSLQIGYADNEHFDACAGFNNSCFPQTPWPPAAGDPTIFLGAGARAVEACGNGHPLAGDGGCYDAGALKITAIAAPVSPGDTATIGFWHNKNGQAVINCENGGGTSTALGNWLASNFPHLFGSLAGKTDAQVAAAYLTAFGNVGGVQGNTYVQAFAVALAVYVTNSATGTASCVSKFGFNFGAGTGGKLYNVGSNGAAFGVPNNTSLTVLTILQIANANYDPATGLFYNGDQTLTSELNNVLDGINSSGDI